MIDALASITDVALDLPAEVTADSFDPFRLRQSDADPDPDGAGGDDRQEHLPCR